MLLNLKIKLKELFETSVLFETNYFNINLYKTEQKHNPQEYPCDCVFLIKDGVPLPMSIFEQLTLYGRDVGISNFIYFNFKKSPYDVNCPKDLIYVLEQDEKKEKENQI